MDEQQFDALAKTVARAPSRRQVLRTLGGGSLLAGLGVALGRASAPAPIAAQGAPCTLAFVGTVRLGPSAGQMLAGGTNPGELRGTLSFTADQTGAIAQGQLQLADGSTVPLVGEATGRALNIRLALGGQQVFVAVGTAAQDLTMCQGAADGLLTGPQLGDLGDWHATLSGGGSGGAPGSPAAGAAGTMAASGGNPPPVTTPAPTTTNTTTSPGKTPTATAPASGTDTTTCPVCQQRSNGACVPAADNTLCGEGHLCCGGVCGFVGSDPKNCGTCGNVCSGGCCQGTCVDTSSDPNNCGSCGKVCPAAQPGFVSACSAGTCFFERQQACSSGLAYCNGACVDTSSDANNCGLCGNVCPADHPLCSGGICAADHRTGGTGGGATICPTGQINCGGTCVRAAVCP